MLDKRHLLLVGRHSEQRVRCLSADFEHYLVDERGRDRELPHGRGLQLRGLRLRMLNRRDLLPANYDGEWRMRDLHPRFKHIVVDERLSWYELRRRGNLRRWRVWLRVRHRRNSLCFGRSQWE